MLATVPILCRSAGIGSSASTFRCMTMPTGFCSRTARCAAKIERGRLRAIGNATPGNSTMPRTGTMMSESGGSGGVGAPPAFSSKAVAAAASAIGSPRFFQRDDEATVGRRSVNSAVAARWKPNSAFEPALRKLETVDRRGHEFRRVGPGPRNQEFALIDERFDLLEVDPRQGDENEHRTFGLQHVDRRLPRGGARRLKKLPMHPFGAREHLERFRPHPIARKIRSHRSPCPNIELPRRSIAQFLPWHMRAPRECLMPGWR